MPLKMENITDSGSLQVSRRRSRLRNRYQLPSEMSLCFQRTSLFSEACFLRLLLLRLSSQMSNASTKASLFKAESGPGFYSSTNILSLHKPSCGYCAILSFQCASTGTLNKHGRSSSYTATLPASYEGRKLHNPFCLGAFAASTIIMLLI